MILALLRKPFKKANRIRIVCIGGSPSSGSTLLADLLDSIPTVICGPELNIFCVKDAYSFDEAFKEKAIDRSPFELNSLRAKSSRFFNERHLSLLGMDLELLKTFIRESKDLKEFSDKLALHIGHLRNRKVRVFAEKTPQNILCMEKFLRVFPNQYFVKTIRDGFATVASLKRRGYSLYEATLIWIYETSLYNEYIINNENVLTCKYEELVKDPFAYCSTVANQFGVKVKNATLKKEYINNNFRQQIPGVESWRFSSREPRIGYLRDRFEELSENEIYFIATSVLVRSDGLRLSFKDIMEFFDYDVPIVFMPPMFEEFWMNEIHTYVSSSKYLSLQTDFCLVQEEFFKEERMQIKTITSLINCNIDEV